MQRPHGVPAMESNFSFQILSFLASHMYHIVISIFCKKEFEIKSATKVESISCTPSSLIFHSGGHRGMLHTVNGSNFPVQVNDYPQRRYRIVLRSTMGPIDVYLVRYMLLVTIYAWHCYAKNINSECTSPTCLTLFCWLIIVNLRK